MVDYEKEILRILCEAGVEGLSVYKISVHVHNSCNSLFAPVDFAKVHGDVQTWLLRALRNPNQPVCRCERRGYYRLNMSSSKVRQLFLNFDCTPENERPIVTDNDTQELSLIF